MNSKSISPTHQKYRPDIDGLRAIAILSVLAFHAFPAKFYGGFIGVDIFFVISGYLISSIVLSNLENDSFSIVEFYKKRILRIYPALTFVILVCLIFGWFNLFSEEYIELGKHVAGGAAFVSNFVLWSEASYFDSEATTKPLLHLWSLGVEEQFYIFWPLLLYFFWTKHWSFLKSITCIGLVSFFTGIFLTKTNPTAAFYFPGSRFWELMAGGLLAYINLHKNNIITRSKNTEAFIGLFFILCSLLFIKKTSEFPGWWALLPTAGSFLIIAAGPNAWLNQKVLSNKFIIWIGLISYPLYLWHWPLLAFSEIILGEVSNQSKIAILALSFLLAWLTYKFIETPLKSNRNKKVLAQVLLFIMVLFGCTGFYSYQSGGFEGYGIRTKEKSDFLSYFENSRPNWKYFEKINRSETYRYDCDFYNLEQDRQGKRTIVPMKAISTSCYQRDKSIPNSVFIWGDSHAQMLYYGLKTELPKDWQLMQVASSGCRPNINVQSPSTTFYCDQSNWFALESIRNTKPDVVIVAQKSEHDPVKMENIFKEIKAMGVRKIIFTGPAPQWIPSLPRVIAGNLWGKTPERTFIGLDTKIKAADIFIKNNFKSHPEAEYISLFDSFCNDEGCLVYFGEDRKKGISTYDYGHFSLIASQYIAKNKLLPALMELNENMKINQSVHFR